MKKILLFILIAINCNCFGQSQLKHSSIEVKITTANNTLPIKDCIVKIKLVTDSIWQVYENKNSSTVKFKIDRIGEYEIVALKKECAPYQKNIFVIKDSTYLIEALIICMSCNLIKLNNVYFDFGKTNIKEEGITDIDVMIFTMEKYPTLKIELRGYTSCRGSDLYNKLLSERRAETVKKILGFNHSISDRITIKGYGESYPVNRCVDGVKCTDEEHSQNDRVEFKILSF
jgi:peptidoglycan-associated lipoprotein